MHAHARHDDEPADRGAPRPRRLQVQPGHAGRPPRPQINSYFNQLGDGLGHMVPPQVTLGGPQAAEHRLRGDRRRQDRPRRAARPRPSRTRPTDRGRRTPEPAGRRRPTSAAPRPLLAGRRIVLGVTGGIAAYKAVEVCRRLVDAGAHVVPVMTDGRRALHRPHDAVRARPASRCRRSLWDEADARSRTPGSARRADLVLVAPATARLLGAYAAGLSTDLLTNMLLATRAPVRRLPGDAHRDVGAPGGAGQHRRRCAAAACTSSSRRRAASPAATSAPAASPLRSAIVAAVERVLGRARPRRAARRRQRRRHPRADRRRARHRQPQQRQAGLRRSPPRRAPAAPTVTLVSTVDLPVPPGVRVVARRDRGRDAGGHASARRRRRRRRDGRRRRRLPARGAPPPARSRRTPACPRSCSSRRPTSSPGSARPSGRARCSSASPPRPPTCVANADGEAAAQAPRPDRRQRRQRPRRRLRARHQRRHAAAAPTADPVTVDLARQARDRRGRPR